jgi:tetratricopeptide (TPR) repeat protein
MDKLSPGPGGLMIRYLDGEMTHEEELEFENLLANDKELLEELQDLQITVEAIQLYGLKQKVAAVHHLMMEELTPVKQPVLRITHLAKGVRYSLAISAAILLLFLLIQAYKFYTLSTEGLFSEKYKDFKTGAITGDSTTNLSIEKSFRNAKYQQVIYFHNKNHFSRINDLFLLGLAYLKTENLSKAIDSFNSILDKNKLFKTDTLQDETEYYLALAYLKNKDYDQAIVLMEKIHDDNAHLYQGKFTGTYIRRVKMMKWR